MAEKFKLLTFLWLVIGCVAQAHSASTIMHRDVIMAVADNSSMTAPTPTPVGATPSTPTPVGTTTPSTPTPVGATPSTPTPVGATTPSTPTPVGATTPSTPTPVGATPSTATPVGATTPSTPTPVGATTPSTPTPVGATPSTPTPVGATPSTPTPVGATTPSTPTPVGATTPSTPTPVGATTPSTSTPVGATTPPTAPASPPVDATTRPTPTPGPCSPNPCGQGSSCEVYSNQSFVCSCLPGENYNYERKSCENAKIFPGVLTLQDITFHENMTIKGSPEFIEAAQNITTTLVTVFNSTMGFSNVTVLKIEETESQSRAAQEGIKATVDIIFLASSDVKTTDVSKLLNHSNLSFSEGKLCDGNPCDEVTTDCEGTDGFFTCTCKETHIKTNFSDRICIACGSGSEVIDGKCEYCAFGFSGFNCQEYWELALAIVGSVLGGMLLICLIILLVLHCKSPKKSSKKNQNVDLGKPYVSHSPAKSPLVYSNSYLDNSQQSSQTGLVYGKGGMPEIPRAKASSIWDRATNLELPSRNNRQNMDRESNHYVDDDMNSHGQSRPQKDHSAFAQPRNPYVQNRSPVNPYSQSQGYNNPSFVQDNGRFRN